MGQSHPVVWQGKVRVFRKGRLKGIECFGNPSVNKFAQPFLFAKVLGFLIELVDKKLAFEMIGPTQLLIGFRRVFAFPLDRFIEHPNGRVKHALSQKIDSQREVNLGGCRVRLKGLIQENQGLVIIVIDQTDQRNDVASQEGTIFGQIFAPFIHQNTTHASHKVFQFSELFGFVNISCLKG